MRINGQEFGTLGEAIQETYASGRGQVIGIAGKYIVVERSEAERLETLGVPFTYYHDVLGTDGQYRTVSVPAREN